MRFCIIALGTRGDVQPCVTLARGLQLAGHDVCVAGEAFFVDGSGRNLVRLSFSAPSPERILEGVRRFAAAVAEELDALTSRAAGEPPASRRAAP